MARNNGNKSWYNELILIYSLYKIIWGNRTASDTDVDTGVMIAPFSFSRTGLYDRNNGIRQFRGSYSTYWIIEITNESMVKSFSHSPSALVPQNNDEKGKGLPVRCVAKCGDATDSICPKGWEMARNSENGGWIKLLIDTYGRNINKAVKIDSSFVANDYRIYNGIIHLPISILLNGEDQTGRTTYGYYFSSKIASKDAPFSLWFSPTTLHIIQGTVHKGRRHSVCCVAKLATDSICPKGWEMARYNGDKSHYKLVYEVYNKYSSANLSTFSDLDDGVKSFPFSYLRSNRYAYGSGKPNHNALGYYFESNIESNSHIRTFSFCNTYLVLGYHYEKGYGNSVRCVAKFATDSICPKGWEMARGSGDGGWAKLLVAVYGKNSDGSVKIDSSFVSNNYKLYDGIIYSPASILLNGGGISNRGSYGYYFSSKLASRDASISLWFYSTALYNYGSVRKGSFHSVRCVVKIGDATDSICPKGWEMARYEGDGSWDALLALSYSKYQIGAFANTTEADAGIKTLPLSLSHAGYYDYVDGKYYYRSMHGYYTESRIDNASVINLLYFHSARFHPSSRHLRKRSWFLRSLCRQDWRRY